jgi:hypothetical protein
MIYLMLLFYVLKTKMYIFSNLSYQTTVGPELSLCDIAEVRAIAI